jgi:hypothetical protein
MKSKRNRPIQNNKVMIEFTRVECDALLSELRHNLLIYNKDNRNALLLWEKIAYKYFGEEQNFPKEFKDKIFSFGKPEKPDPPPLRSIKESEDTPTNTEKPKQSFWKWFFGDARE